MGSTIGSIAGTALGSAVGGPVGGQIGGAIGGSLFGGSGGSSGGGGMAVAPFSPLDVSTPGFSSSGGKGTLSDENQEYYDMLMGRRMGWGSAIEDYLGSPEEAQQRYFEKSLETLRPEFAQQQQILGDRLLAQGLGQSSLGNAAYAGLGKGQASAISDAYFKSGDVVQGLIDTYLGRQRADTTESMQFDKMLAALLEQSLKGGQYAAQNQGVPAASGGFGSGLFGGLNTGAIGNTLGRGISGLFGGGGYTTAGEGYGPGGYESSGMAWEDATYGSY